MNEISSLQVGKGTIVALYLAPFYGGYWHKTKVNIPRLSAIPLSNRPGSSSFNDRVGSLIVYPDASNPFDDEVTVCTDRDYKGQCQVLGQGDYFYSDRIGLKDNSMSSIRVGSQAQAILCRKSRFRDDCERFRNDDPSFSDNHIPDNSVSAMRVQRDGYIPCSPSSQEVSVYGHRDFIQPCSKLSKGKYRIKELGLEGEYPSSLKIGAGDVQACICTSSTVSTSGKCQVFSGDVNLLKDTSVAKNIASIEVAEKGKSCGGSKPLTCDGKVANGNARQWAVAFKNPRTSCTDNAVLTYFANSYDDAKACGERQTGFIAINKVCQYFMKIERGSECVDRESLAGSISDAVSCAINEGWAGYNITDITKEVTPFREPGSCSGGVDYKILDNICD